MKLNISESKMSKGIGESLNVKIKVTSAEIVVHGTADKPYYEIKYYKLHNEKCYVGYGSYELKYVFEWLKECFEIVESEALVKRSDKMKAVFPKAVQEDLDKIDELILEMAKTCTSKEEYDTMTQPLYDLKVRIYETSVCAYVTETEEEKKQVEEYLRRLKGETNSEQTSDTQ